MLPVKGGISVCFHPFLVMKTSFNDADIKGALWNISVVLNTTNKKGLLQVLFYRLFRRAALTLDFYFYKCYHDHLFFFFFYFLALSESVEIMPSACIFHLCWHFWASAFWAVAAQLPANNSSQGGRAGRYKKKNLATGCQIANIHPSDITEEGPASSVVLTNASHPAFEQALWMSNH